MKTTPLDRLIWKGHFAYQNETNDGIMWEQEVQFEMELFFTGNTFYGTIPR